MTAEELEQAWREGRRDFDGVAVEVTTAYVDSWTTRARAQRKACDDAVSVRTREHTPDEVKAAIRLGDAAVDELRRLALVREVIQRLNPESRGMPSSASISDDEAAPEAPVLPMLHPCAECGRPTMFELCAYCADPDECGHAH